MAAVVYRVCLPGVSAAGRTVFVNFECGYQDFDALLDDLNRGDLIAGTMLLTRRAREDVDSRLSFEVFGRRPYAISKQGIGTIEVPVGLRFVEEEG